MDHSRDEQAEQALLDLIAGGEDERLRISERLR
jgi:hypothetical protein